MRRDANHQAAQASLRGVMAVPRLGAAIAMKNRRPTLLADGKERVESIVACVECCNPMFRHVVDHSLISVAKVKIITR